ncbi:hypothetical protein [Flagellimonas amoyensis]|uniref:hypothetical protein n=1 Tax=Flagellimonas amoyensis TaxID=2169401 RepID=UPI000D33B467|nr:hypothetical protein [Allomuricauda amoyensis]
MKVFKMRKDFYLVIIAVCFYFKSFGQKNLEGNILGSWTAYKETTLEGDDGSSITLSGEPFKVKLDLVFYKNSKVKRINWIEELDTLYSLKQDTLRISHFIYTIKKLTHDELVLKEERLLGNLIYLHRNSDN